MTKRKIIEIDEDTCNGCGECIPNCPEGALQVIDGKARLVSDLFCDGLGACVGHCPTGAMQVVEREAEAYEEKKVMANIVKQGENTIKAHLKHLKDHGADEFLHDAIEYLKENDLDVPEFEEPEKTLACGCPSSMVQEVEPSNSVNDGTEVPSHLTQWPVQLNLIPAQAPFLKGADLLIAADCVGFADPNFHSKLLKGRKVLIGCPKFDDVEGYVKKLTEIFDLNDVKSVTVAIMEVPCCSSLYRAVETAAENSKKEIKIDKVVVGISGSSSP